MRATAEISPHRPSFFPFAFLPACLVITCLLFFMEETGIILNEREKRKAAEKAELESVSTEEAPSPRSRATNEEVTTV